MTITKIDNETFADIDPKQYQKIPELDKNIAMHRDLLEILKSKDIKDVRQSGADEAEFRHKQMIEDLERSISEQELKKSEVETALGGN